MRLGERHEVPLNYARFEARERIASTVDTHTHTHTPLCFPSECLVLCSWSVLTGSTMETRLRMALWLQVHSLPLSWSLSSMPDVSTEKRRSKTFPCSIRWKSELAFSLRGFPELRASPFRQIVRSLSLSHTVDLRGDLFLLHEESKRGPIGPVDLSFFY